MRGAQELRVKESDRIESVTSALRAVGGRITATDDGFRVRGVPARPQRRGAVESRGDHRIAMLGALAGLLSREGVERIRDRQNDGGRVLLRYRLGHGHVVIRAKLEVGLGDRL